ncbi:NADPH-dependent oxidoreductase 2-alkenal reductase-like [Benincasa hispida]|uniref:NADPH-dependent oxidoreductase 2-alkenal reductase-like n=1 Tax=Benincasa hispida TaxID=102211 RepID=UPI0018FF1A3E|nr:NADPH-dependent oxidoreductase 2-alkenal reductase-like [Benincasa hispida]
MEEAMKNNSFITIKHHINGFPVESDFELKSHPLRLSAQPGSADIVLKNLSVSVDPYQINRMKTHSPSHTVSSVTPYIIPGQVIDVHGVAEVMDSDDSEFQKGDFVKGIIHWAQYSVVKAGESALMKLDTMEFPLTYYLGILGTSGLSAYAGLFDVGNVKEGDNVFVSAASGSVGNLVGQFAKLQGCYVVGSAGSNQKVALLKEKLGFDEAFNYNQQKDLKSTLPMYFPNGIDIYFDNVGDEMLEAVIANMNPFGRVVVCGVISEYTKSTKGKGGTINMMDIVYKRIKIQGFLVSDYLNVFQDFKSKTAGYLRSGEMKAVEDISEGLHNIPSAFIGLFHGNNIGKKIVKLA